MVAEYDLTKESFKVAGVINLRLYHGSQDPEGLAEIAENYRNTLVNVTLKEARPGLTDDQKLVIVDLLERHDDMGMEKFVCSELFDVLLRVEVETMNTFLADWERDVEDALTAEEGHRKKSRGFLSFFKGKK